jgi:hypothetical protein
MAQMAMKDCNFYVPRRICFFEVLSAAELLMPALMSSALSRSERTGSFVSRSASCNARSWPRYGVRRTTCSVP